MAELELALLLASLMFVVHFLGEELEEHISGYREAIKSFAAGASMTYIFVQLLPEFHSIASESAGFIFVFPLIGFSSLHLIEKYVAKFGFEDEKMRKEYGEIHSVFLFLYHGALGYLIASLLIESTVSGLLFFIPILMHVTVSSFSMTELHKDFFERTGIKLGISIAPLIGVLIHATNLIAETRFHFIFGTVIGMFFYIVIRDSIPGEDRGKPKEYITGMFLYLSVILLAKLTLT